MNSHTRIVWLFGILFILLGLGYAILTPIFENSDETLHYPYVKHLADGNGLPLATPNQLWNQEGTQPPLYYAIVAASTFWINTNNLLDHLQYNPHWLFTDVRHLINDNQNRVLHGPMDDFPYQNAALAIHIGRWWSLIFGVITVVCTFFIARILFPDNSSIAITATALVALTPQFLRVSATVSNDSLSAALASFTVLLALSFTQPLSASSPPRLIVGPIRFSTRQALILGLLAGLALLTKLSSLSVLFLVAIILFWRLFFITENHQQPFKKLLRWLLVVAVVTALLNGWWFFRNYRLYGEWLATETHLNLAGRGHLSLLEIWNLRHEVERAYWATFGWGQIRPPEWIFQLLGLFSRVGLIGLVGAILYKLVLERSNSKHLNFIRLEAVIFLLIWAAMNLVLYVQWVTEVGSVSHTRLIFPAITAIALLLTLGWHALIPRRFGLWLSGAVTISLLALNIFVLGWLIAPAFTPTTDNSGTTEVNVTFENSLKLIGGNTEPMTKDEGRRTKEVQQGDDVAVRAEWQVLAPIDTNLSVSALLLAPNGDVLARRNTYPGLGLRPTKYLFTGQQFTDTYPLTIETDVTEPMVARAVVSLFDYESSDRAGLAAIDANGNEVTPVVGLIKVVPVEWSQYQPQQPASVNFNNAIQLTGFDLGTDDKENSLNSPNSFNSLTLYWRSLAPVDTDYTLFIHLLDETGNILAQADAPPTGNRYPTSWWSPNEIIADTHTVPDAPGKVAIRFGLYDPATGQRLSITESSLPQQDNSITIKISE